jgi:hypothetical protein
LAETGAARLDAADLRRVTVQLPGGVVHMQPLLQTQPSQVRPQHAASHGRLQFS